MDKIFNLQSLDPTDSLEIHSQVSQASQNTKQSLQEAFKRVCSELSIEEMLNGHNSSRSVEQKLSAPFEEMLDSLKAAEAKRLHDDAEKMEKSVKQLKEELGRLRAQIAVELAGMEEQSSRMTSLLDA